MKTASKILLIVGASLSMIMAVTFIILGVVFVFMGIDPQAKADIINGLENGTVHSSFTGTTEEQAVYIQAMFFALGFVFVIWAALLVLGGTFSFISVAKKKTPLYILAIVFGIISCVFLNSVGAIFGLISNSKQSE